MSILHHTHLLMTFKDTGTENILNPLNQSQLLDNGPYQGLFNYIFKSAPTS